MQALYLWLSALRACSGYHGKPEDSYSWRAFQLTWQGRR